MSYCVQSHPPAPGDLTFLFFFDRPRFGGALCEQFLRALGARDTSRHVSLLLNRQTNSVPFVSGLLADWRASGINADLDFYGVKALSHVLDLPVHVYESPGYSWRWTVNVFNPNNIDFKFSCNFVEDEVVLELTIENSSFGPNGRSHFAIGDSAMNKYQQFNRVLCEAVRATRPVFMLGDGGDNLAVFIGCSRRVPCIVSWHGVAWPWALYTKDLSRSMALDFSRLHFVKPTPQHPSRFMRTEMLDNGDVLVWTVEDCEDDMRVYASALGLQSLYEV